jgi:stress response protein SCP2
MLQNQKLVIPSNQLKIGISWDLIEKIDLDCQCVLLNDLGQVEDAVYYNQQKSKCGNVQHSGDI